MEDRTKVIIFTIATFLVVFLVLFYIVNPWGRAQLNNYEAELLTVDYNTTYAGRTEIEKTCRSMIASYQSDMMRYASYKNSHPDWAEQAKIRANQTAIRYNEYILKYTYIWRDSIPADIRTELPLIGE